MKNRFIIPIDLSEYSSSLRKYALDWSKRVNAELRIVQKGLRLLTRPIFRKFLIDELEYEGQTLLIVLP